MLNSRLNGRAGISESHFYFRNSSETLKQVQGDDLLFKSNNYPNRHAKFPPERTGRYFSISSSPWKLVQDPETSSG